MSMSRHRYAAPQAWCACALSVMFACAAVAGPADETPDGLPPPATSLQPPAQTSGAEPAATPSTSTDASEAQRLFEQAKRALLPVTPDQIRDFRQSYDAAQAAKFGGPAPALVNREVQIEVVPGMTAPTVHVSPPFVTSVVFVDATGAPWPLTSLDGGNEDGAFSVNWDEQRKVPPHNLVTVRPLQNHVSSNLVVTLQGFALPVSLVLDADSRNEHGLHPKSIDGMLTIKLMQRGPEAQTPVVGPGPRPAIYPILYKFLYDTPPEGAQAVALEPAIGKAWIYNQSLYYRTNKPLRWPAWTAQANAPGGTAVYEMPLVPLLMLSIDGGTVNVTVDTTATAMRGAAYGG